MLRFSNRKMILEKNLDCGSVKADEMTKVKRPYFKGYACLGMQAYSSVVEDTSFHLHF